MATFNQMVADLRKADEQGLTEDAKYIASRIRAAQQLSYDYAPDQEIDWQVQFSVPEGLTAPAAHPLNVETKQEKPVEIGTYTGEVELLVHPNPIGDAAKTLISGATTGTLGLLAGTVEGLVKQGLDTLAGSTWEQAGEKVNPEHLAERAASGMTRMPHSERGAQYVQNVVETLAPLEGLAPQLTRGLSGVKTLSKQAILDGDRLVPGKIVGAVDDVKTEGMKAFERFSTPSKNADIKQLDFPPKKHTQPKRWTPPSLIQKLPIPFETLKYQHEINPFKSKGMSQRDKQILAKQVGDIERNLLTLTDESVDDSHSISRAGQSMVDAFDSDINNPDSRFGSLYKSLMNKDDLRSRLPMTAGVVSKTIAPENIVKKVLDKNTSANDVSVAMALLDKIDTSGIAKKQLQQAMTTKILSQAKTQGVFDPIKFEVIMTEYFSPQPINQWLGPKRYNVFKRVIDDTPQLKDRLTPHQFSTLKKAVENKGVLTPEQQTMLHELIEIDEKTPLGFSVLQRDVIAEAGLPTSKMSYLFDKDQINTLTTLADVSASHRTRKISKKEMVARGLGDMALNVATHGGWQAIRTGRRILNNFQNHGNKIQTK